MNASQIKTALDKAVKPVPFVVFTEKKFAKPELEIGASAKAKLKELARPGKGEIEGKGVCRKESDVIVIFSAKVAKPPAKSLINSLCRGAGFTDVRFKEGKDADADLATDGALEDGADAPMENGSSANGGSRTVPQTRFAPQMDVAAKNPPPPVPATPPARGSDWTAARPTAPSGGNPPPPNFANVGTARQAPPTPPNDSSVARVAKARTLPAVATNVSSAAQTEVATVLSDAELAKIKKTLKGNVGAFGGVIDKVAAAAQDAPILAMLSKPRNGNSDLRENINQEQVKKMRTAQLEKYDEALAALKSYDPKDDVDVATEKMSDEREKFRANAKATLTKAANEIRFSQRVGLIDKINKKNDTLGLTDKEEELFHKMRAEMLIYSVPQELDVKASGGSGFTRLLRDDQGRVAYAFKSIAGESSNMRTQGFAEGAITGQEILTSKLSDVLGSLCGFNSGFPKTTLATLPVSDLGGKENLGALVEGLDGKPVTGVEGAQVFAAWTGTADDNQGDPVRAMSQEEKDHAVARCKAKYEATRNDRFNPDKPGKSAQIDAYMQLLWAEFQEKVNHLPTEQLQSALLMGLASANADVKWSNLMVDGDNVRPFDGGGAMLSEKDMLLQAKGGRRDGAIQAGFGQKFLQMPHYDSTDGIDATIGLHPFAKEPLDPSFIEKFEKLNLEEVRRQMMATVTSLRGANETFNATVSASNVECSIRSMQCMKEAMLENRTQTTEQFVDAYNKKMQAWLEGVAAAEGGNG